MKQSECGHRFLCTQVQFLACNHNRLKHFQVMLWSARAQDLKCIVIIGFHTVRILLQVVGDRWLILVPVYFTWPFHFCSITWFHCFAWTARPLLSQLWDWLLLLLRLPVWSFWWSSSHRFLCMRGVCLQMYWHMWFNMSGRGSVLKGHSTYHHSYPWHSNR